MNHKEQLFVLAILVVLLNIFLGRMFILHVQKSVSPTIVQEEKKEYRDPFANLSLTARAAIVWDIKKRAPMFALHEHAQLPLASLTKIMTALVAFEEKGGEGVVVVSKEAIKEEGDHGFAVGERWRLKDLIDATLTTSSNDGAHALASVFAAQTTGSPVFSGESVFIQKMNDKVKTLGLSQTFFADEVGLDFNLGVSGAYGSAYDMAQILEYVVLHNPTLMEATTRTLLTVRSLDGITHNFENTNKFVETLPGVIASKTGFTDLAGGNLAIVFEAGPTRPIAVVVLGSTAEERFSDTKQLISASLEYLKHQ